MCFSCQMSILPRKTGYFMYSKKNCKWCQIATEKLPNVVTVTVDLCPEETEEFWEKMAEMIGTDDRFFPMVFYNGIFLGGCTESLEHLELSSEVLRRSI